MAEDGCEVGYLSTSQAGLSLGLTCSNVYVLELDWRFDLLSLELLKF